MKEIIIQFPEQYAVQCAIMGWHKQKAFYNICQGLVCKSDPVKYPQSFFLFKNGKWVFEIKKNQIWCRSETVWNGFESDFNMGYDEIQEFIKIMVDKHFSLKDMTPKIEEYRKLKGVDKHFSLKDMTPSPTYSICSLIEDKHFSLK